ncbi:MAG: hypothetical protein AAFY71_19170 [Bacteroidota bacterium]
MFKLSRIQLYTFIALSFFPLFMKAQEQLALKPEEVNSALSEISFTEPATAELLNIEIVSFTTEYNPSGALVPTVVIQEQNGKDLGPFLGKIKITVLGVVQWSDGKTASCERTLRRDSHTNNQAVYSGPLSTEVDNTPRSVFQEKRGQGNPNWRYIKDYRLRYVFPNQIGKTPANNLYPCINSQQNIAAKVYVADAYITPEGDAFIKLEADPSGTLFEVSDLVLVNKSTKIEYKNISVESIGRSKLLKIKGFEAGSAYQLKGKAMAIRNYVTFEKIDLPLSLSAKKVPYIQEVRINNTVFSKENQISVSGVNEVKIEVITQNISGLKLIPRVNSPSGISPMSTNEDNGKFTFVLKNLSSLTTVDLIPFYLSTDQGQKVGDDYFFIRDARVTLNEVDFNLSEDKETQIQFKLPLWADKQKVTITTEKNNFSTDFTNNPPIAFADGNQFTYTLNNNAFFKDASDKKAVIQDRIIIKYAGKKIWSLKVSFVNMALVNKKLAELAVKVDELEKTKKRKTEEIEKLNTQISELLTELESFKSQENDSDSATSVETKSDVISQAKTLATDEKEKFTKKAGKYIKENWTAIAGYAIKYGVPLLMAA